MNIHHRLRRWFKLRFAILYPRGGYLVLFVNPDDKSIRLGMGTMLLAAGFVIMFKIYYTGMVLKYIVLIILAFTLATVDLVGEYIKFIKKVVAAVFKL